MKRVLILVVAVLAVFSCVITEAAPSLLPFDPQWTASEVRDLVAAGADVNERREKGLTPLMVAAIDAKNSDVINVLVAAGANVMRR